MRRSPPLRLLLTLSLGIGLLAAAGPAGAATWRVPLDAADIQAGIELSDPGDTLMIAPNTYYAHGLRMKSGITMLGDGAPEQIVIDAQRLGMVIDLAGTGGDTRIANITFTGGYTTGDSPGEDKYPIACIESTANFENCIFVDNISWNDGAGFYCADAAPILVDCEFLYNESTKGSGGGLCSRRSNPVLVNCVFRGNAAAGYGGGAFLTGSGSEPRLQKCVFEENSAYGGGGIGGSVVPVTIVGSIIRGNSASFAGGGVHLQAGSSLDAHTGTFFANAAPKGKTVWALANSSVVFHCSDVDYLGIEGGCTPHFYYEGCRETPTEAVGWGEIKSFYR